MNIACFGVDPGGATGLAWGIFNPKAQGAAEALKNRMRDGSDTIEGDERKQIREIGERWREFYADSVGRALLPPDRVFLVVENFIYTGANYGGDSARISTAIIWGLEGYRMGRRDEWRKHKRGKGHMPAMVLQTAGDAQQFAKKALLQDCGCWIVGRDHERSAWRHLALFLQRYINQHSRVRA